MLKIEEVEWDGDRSSPLAQQLRRSVELKMLYILDCGAIPEGWIKRATEFGMVLAEKGDILLYPDKKTLNEANKIFDGLVTAVAVLSFVHGGVDCFGWHFEAKHEEKTGTNGEKIRQAIRVEQGRAQA